MQNSYLFCFFSVLVESLHDNTKCLYQQSKIKYSATNDIDCFQLESDRVSSEPLPIRNTVSTTIKISTENFNSSPNTNESSTSISYRDEPYNIDTDSEKEIELRNKENSPGAVPKVISIISFPSLKARPEAANKTKEFV